MSGRCCLFSPIENIATQSGVQVPGFEYKPRYNIAPSQLLPIIFNENNLTKIELMKWGMVLPWATSIADGNKYINSRSETVKDKPSSRNSFKTRRCIIPVNGYYEFVLNEHSKQPLLFTLKSDELMFIAGLWEEWKTPHGNILRSFTVLTTSPNELILPIHHRMPVILRPFSVSHWLTNGYSLEEYESVLKTYPADEMKFKKVSQLLNDVRIDYPELLDENFTGFNTTHSDGGGIVML